MPNTKNSLESNLFRSFWDDGLLDLLCGVGLVGVGVGWVSDGIVFTALMPPVLAAFWGPLRARVVEPRGGYVKFSKARQDRNSRSMWVTLVFGAMTFVLFLALFIVVRDQGATPAAVRLVPGLPATLIALGLSFAGWFTGARRFHLYAVALVVAAIASIHFNISPGPPLLATGLFVVASGATVLSRFIKASSNFQDSEGI